MKAIEARIAVLRPTIKPEKINVKPILPRQELDRLEEFLKRYNNALIQLCDAEEIDDLQLRRFQIVFRAIKDYAPLLAHFERWSQLEEDMERIKGKVATAFIVADTWDAIAKKLGKEDRLRTEGALVRRCDETDANIVFVSEEPEQTTLDYLVDGIVTLRRGGFEDRLMREIELNKLRGVECKQHKYLFTLTGGRFQCFGPWSWQTIPREKRKLAPVHEDNDPETASTCVDGLDELIGGGWEKGSLNLIEIDENVGTGYYGVVVPAALSFINMRRVFVSFPSGGESGYVLARAFFAGHAKKFEGQTRFIHSKKTPQSEEVPYVIHIDTSDPVSAEEEFYKFGGEFIEKSKDRSMLTFVGSDTFEREFGVDAAMGMLSRAARRVKSSRSVELLLLKEGQRLPKCVVHLASTHWKLKQKDGAMMFYGVVPHTGIHIMETDFSKGYPKTKITPIH